MIGSLVLSTRMPVAPVAGGNLSCEGESPLDGAVFAGHLFGRCRRGSGSFHLKRHDSGHRCRCCAAHVQAGRGDRRCAADVAEHPDDARVSSSKRHARFRCAHFDVCRVRCDIRGARERRSSRTAAAAAATAAAATGCYASPIPAAPCPAATQSPAASAPCALPTAPAAQPSRRR